MFVARFFLGFGIGPKSATVPIYAAETTPPAIRGALVMQWQMWTAFGIMLGYVADLMFYRVPDPPNITGLNWRLMMASAMFPALIVICFVFLCPESPRWYMSKGRHAKAYRSMIRLRYTKVQAARDVFYMHTLLDAESNMTIGQSKVLELITVPRNRRALVGSEIVMFMQQVRLLDLFALCPMVTDEHVVLWRQCHRVLLLSDLYRSQVLRDLGIVSFLGFWDHQLAFRHPGDLHD